MPDPDADVAAQPQSGPGSRLARWILPQPAFSTARLAVRRKTGEIINSLASDALLLAAHDADDFGGSCSACGEASRRPSGRAPFSDWRAVHARCRRARSPRRCSPDAAAADKAFSGRRLLTFTDARQGTARLSAKLQADAERAFLRAFVYHAVQSKPPRGTAEEIAKQRAIVSELERIGSPTLADTLAKARAELATKEGTAEGPPIPWNDMRDRLAQNPTLLHIKSLWEIREDAFQNPGDLAHFLLLREFLRRAVRGNSAETMGLARLVLPHHQENAEPPPSARALSLSGDDWRDLLCLVVTHFLRLNTIVSIMPSAFNWIDRRPTHVAVRQFDPRTATADPWPAVRSVAKPSRVVSLLAQATGISLDDPGARELINETLDQARLKSSRYFEPAQGGGFRIDMRTLSLGKVKSAWICPITRRVVDTVLKGLSPYPRDCRHLNALPITLPEHPFPFLVHPSESSPHRRDRSLSGLRP